MEQSMGNLEARKPMEKVKRTKDCYISHAQSIWEEKAKKYKSLGFDEVCEKPLNHAAVRAILKRYLSPYQLNSLKNINERNIDQEKKSGRI